MTTIEIPCPDAVLFSLKEDSSIFAEDFKMAAAAKFYEMGRLSSGIAAELAGMSRVSFLKRIAQYGVSALNLTKAEMEEDMRNA